MSMLRRSMLCASVTLATSAFGCTAESPSESPTENPKLATTLPIVDAADYVQDDVDAAEGMARMRISVMTHGTGSRAVSIDGVRVCQEDACFQAKPALHEKLDALITPVGVKLADLSIPDGTYSHVVLESGEAGLSTSIALRDPLLLEPGHRGEIFLEITSHEGKLGARFAGAGSVAPDASTAVLAEPEHALHVELPHGAELTLSRGSVREATVIGLDEQLVGNLTARVQMTPDDELHAAASVRLPVNMKRVPAGFSLNDYEVDVSGETRTMPLMASDEKIEVQLERLGRVDVRTLRAYADASDGTSIVPAESALVPKASTATCVARLTANLPSYLTSLKTRYGLLLHDCVSVAPFVHIVLVNTQMAGFPTSAEYARIMFPIAPVNTDGSYNLRRLTTHAANNSAFAAINGYTWSGSSGTAASPGTGKFVGTAFLEGLQKKVSTSNEAIIGFTRRNDGATRGTRSRLFSKTGSTLPELPPYHWNAVGSTTSILKASACTQPSTNQNVNRWSAIGISADRMAMVSSTSTSTTSAYELCSVFSALKSTNAIRMDGGPSTQIVFNGTLLNPIDSLTNPVNYAAFGSARYILFGVAARP